MNSSPSSAVPSVLVALEVQPHLEVLAVPRKSKTHFQNIIRAFIFVFCNQRSLLRLRGIFLETPKIAFAWKAKQYRDLLSYSQNPKRVIDTYAFLYFLMEENKNDYRYSLLELRQT